MTRRAPTTNRTYPLFPDPTLFRSVDHLRRLRRRTEDIEAQPESVLAVDPVVRHEVKIPEGLLSPRQALVLELLYQRDMTPGEAAEVRSEEHTSELQSLMRISYAVFCLKKRKYNYTIQLTI